LAQNLVFEHHVMYLYTIKNGQWIITSHIWPFQFYTTETPWKEAPTSLDSWNESHHFFQKVHTSVSQCYRLFFISCDLVLRSPQYKATGVSTYYHVFRKY
jgi:hypothetical protein